MLDFGIAGKTAVVCASSKGLGFGCADALGAVGTRLVMNGRTPETLAAAELINNWLTEHQPESGAVAVGRLARQKNLPGLLGAFTSVHRAEPEARLRAVNE